MLYFSIREVEWARRGEERKLLINNGQLVIVMNKQRIV